MTKHVTRVALKPSSAAAIPPVRIVGWLLIPMMLWASMAQCASIKSAGSLSASASRIMAISTDPLFQEVLNSDFGAARTAPGAKTLTLTVSVITRVLTPGLSIGEIAPGVPAAPGLLRKAGYVPDSIAQPQAAGTTSPDIAAYMANGGPLPEQRDNLTSQQLFQNPGPPGTVADLPRDAVIREFAPPAPDAAAAKTYQTALVAHAVLSNGGDMTVVALVLPGEDMEAAKKDMAERIVNAVLH